MMRVKQNVSFKLEFSLLIFYFIWGYIYYIWHYSHCLYLPIGDANNDTTISIRFGWKLITNNWKPIVDNQNWKFYNRNKSTILYGTKEFLKPWLSFFILSKVDSVWTFSRMQPNAKSRIIRSGLVGSVFVSRLWCWGYIIPQGRNRHIYEKVDRK